MKAIELRQKRKKFEQVFLKLAKKQVKNKNRQSCKDITDHRVTFFPDSSQCRRSGLLGSLFAGVGTGGGGKTRMPLGLLSIYGRWRIMVWRHVWYKTGGRCMRMFMAAGAKNEREDMATSVGGESGGDYGEDGRGSRGEVFFWITRGQG